MSSQKLCVGVHSVSNFGTEPFDYRVYQQRCMEAVIAFGSQSYLIVPSR